jgi:hypothetical protein
VWQIAAAWSPSGCSTWQRCGAAGKPSWHGSSLRFWLSSDSLRPGAQYLVMTRGPKHLHEVCSLSVVVLACRLASWVSRGLAKPADCECTPERLLSTLFYSISFCTVGGRGKAIFHHSMHRSLHKRSQRQPLQLLPISFLGERQLGLCATCKRIYVSLRWGIIALAPQQKATNRMPEVPTKCCHQSDQINCCKVCCKRQQHRSNPEV